MTAHFDPCFVVLAVLVTKSFPFSLDEFKFAAEYQKAEVRVTGDLDLDPEVTLVVGTPPFTRSFRLRRVYSPVLHEELTSFSVTGFAYGVPKLQFETVQEDLHKKARQFFHDEKSGALVSIVRTQDTVHVNGFLDQETKISPPEMPVTYWTHSSRTARSGRGSDDTDPPHTVWRRGDTPPHHGGLYTSHLTKNMEGTANDSGDEEDDRFVSRNDYLEVPAMFMDKALWSENAKTSNSLTSRDTGATNRNPSDIYNHSSAEGAREAHKRRGKGRGRRQTIGDARSVPLQSVSPGNQQQQQFPSGPGGGTYVVEAMVMVDMKLCAAFNYDSQQLEDYILHFWQAVSLRLQAIVEPRVQLKIRSYGKFLFPGFQPFIENSRVPGSTSRVSMDDAFEGFRAWMQTYESNAANPPHDVAILMTGENLCKMVENGTWVDSPKGVGYKGGACVTASRFPSYTYDVAVIEADRVFGGVLAAAHELGHLLGASHDGEGDALSCSKSSGFVMGYGWKDAYTFNRFSPCSKASIASFLKQTWYADCLSDGADSSAYQFPSRLPGADLSLDDQCRRYNSGIACSTRSLESQCQNLCCESIVSVSVSKLPAADGTFCGPGKACFAGECLAEEQLPRVPIL